MVRPQPLQPLIFAHRGSSLLAPENTRVAFELALGFGADVLETDVRLSGDGVVFVTHDARLERTTNGLGRVRDHAAAHLETLDAGYRFVGPDGHASRDQGVRLMTLGALLEDFPDARVNVDIKDDDAAAAQAVATTVAAHSAEARVTVGSFHSKTLRLFRRLAPAVATAATREEVARLYFGRFVPDRTLKRSHVSTGTSDPFHWLQIPTAWHGLPLATEAFIRYLQARDLRVAYWTINEAEPMRSLFGLGIDALVTDRPDIARAVLRG